jgi:uncharacterized BrkB/YihY/UPF0761 family membrane protein
MFRSIIELFKATFADWQEDNASRLAAALAYYAAISLAPLVIILVAIVGFVLGPDAARGEIAAELQGLIGSQSAQVIEEIIEGANKPVTGVVATVVGIATLLAGASGVFGALQDGLNTIWEVTPKPGRGLLGVVKDRFLSLTIVLGVCFLLLVSLLVSAALAALGRYIGGSLPLPSTALALLNFLISFGVITFLFALIYKVLPDVEIAWKVSNRAISRTEHGWKRLRRGGVAGSHPDLGLLLCADPLFRGGVHPGLRQQVRHPNRTHRKRNAFDTGVPASARDAGAITSSIGGPAENQREISHL